MRSQVEWKTINWRQVQFQVFKLQKRIYRASQRGNVKLVRRLQKMMAKSWYAKLLAVRRVTQENKGKKTAGIDGIKAMTPKQRLELASNLKLNGKSRPTRRVWIPKPGRKEMRPLGIPTMEERAKQALLKLALEPEWEAIFEPNSYGFRPGRSCHDAIKAIRIAIQYIPKYVLDADIASCFDRINHERLLEKVNTFPKFRRQIKAWLTSGVIDFSQWAEKKGYNETTQGTPQGGVLSPLLANIALHGMEEFINSLFPSDQRGSLKTECGYGYRKVRKPLLIRYADDLVILNENLSVIQKCQEAISKWLTTIGLELKPEKTRITHTLSGENPGFNFLGFEIRQYQVSLHRSGKVNQHKRKEHVTIIKPAKEKIKEHYRKLKKVVEEHKSASQTALIGKLNPIISGWANYQTPSNARETFEKLDHLLFQKLWAWAKRRHPHKNNTWKYNRYWQKIGNDRWVFAVNRKVGNPLTLLKHCKKKSGVKWEKVAENRSPYDGDSLYWSKRMGHNYKVLAPQVARLLKRQKGRCAHCGLDFNQNDILEKHHIIPRNKGGNNSDRNLVLLHLHCHDQLHGNSKKTNHADINWDNNPF